MYSAECHDPGMTLASGMPQRWPMPPNGVGSGGIALLPVFVMRAAMSKRDRHHRKRDIDTEPIRARQPGVETGSRISDGVRLLQTKDSLVTEMLASPAGKKQHTERHFIGTA